MLPAISAYESAENAHVIPASRNEMMIAGPACGTATPRMTKIPVPTIEPTENIVRAVRPMVRLRVSVPPRLVSASIWSTDFLRNRRSLIDHVGVPPGRRLNRSHRAPIEDH